MNADTDKILLSLVCDIENKRAELTKLLTTLECELERLPRPMQFAGHVHTMRPEILRNVVNGIIVANSIPPEKLAALGIGIVQPEITK